MPISPKQNVNPISIEKKIIEITVLKKRSFITFLSLFFNFIRMSKYQRPFQSGSRQAPDPFDQFLEQNGYFRKHTARDPSSLFRVISEQLFDTQSYHETVRKTCVEFMTRYPEYFEKV